MAEKPFVPVILVKEEHKGPKTYSTANRLYFNELAEQMVLKAIFDNPDALEEALAAGLSEGDFFGTGYRRMFHHLRLLAEEGAPISVESLADEMEREGDLEYVGGLDYLERFFRYTPHPTSLRDIVEIVCDLGAVRRLEVGCQRLLQLITIEGAEPHVIRRAADRILSLQIRENPWRTDVTFPSAAELSSAGLKEIQWLARPWVAGGAITEIAGKVKQAGKTTLVTHLVRAVLDGAPFLGQPTRKSPVVYLTEQTASTFRVAMARAGLESRQDLFVLPWNATLGIPWPELARLAVGECHSSGAKLLVVDTLAQFAGLFGEAENSSGAALRAMYPLQAAAAGGLGVIVVRHERKIGGAVGDAARGSSAYSGAVDVVLSLRRPAGHHRQSVRLIQALSRFDETPAELAIDWVDGAFLVLGSGDDLASQHAEDVIRQAAPASEADALTLEELIRGTEVSRSTARRVLERLVEQGVFARLGTGRRTAPYRYWNLTDVSVHL